MTIEAGLAFAHALATKDGEALLGLLADDVDFRALTPSRAWEESSSKAFVTEVMTRWFGDGDHIEALVACHARPVAGARYHMSYQLRVRNDDGPHLVEQHAYFECVDGRITWLRVLCAGYIPL